MNSALLITSSLFLTTFIVLLYPLLTTLAPGRFAPDSLVHNTKNAVKLAFFISLPPLFLFLNNGTELIVANLNLMNTLIFDVNISIKFDHYSIIFTPIALYVTWSILEFAS